MTRSELEYQAAAALVSWNIDGGNIEIPDHLAEAYIDIRAELLATHGI